MFAQYPRNSHAGRAAAGARTGIRTTGGGILGKSPGRVYPYHLAPQEMNSAPKAFVLTALGTASGAARQRRLAAGVVLATIWVAGAGCTRSPRYSQNATLTTVEQVRQLTSEGAAAQIPAHLRATVIFSDAPVLLLLVQDSTGAIRVEGAPMAGLTLEPGLPIELTGVVTSGGVSPVVSSRSLVVRAGRACLRGVFRRARSHRSGLCPGRPAA